MGELLDQLAVGDAHISERIAGDGKGLVARDQCARVPGMRGFPLASSSAGAEKTMFKLGPGAPSLLRAALPSQPSASMRKSRRAPNSSSMARTLSRKPSQE